MPRCFKPSCFNLHRFKLHCFNPEPLRSHFRLRAALLLGVLALSLHAAPAWALYRCSTPQGNSWSDRPCDKDGGGRGGYVEPAAPPDPAAAREAARRAAQQQSEVRRLSNERERQAKQDESARIRAETGRQAHQKRCKLLEMKKRWGEEDAAQANLRREAKAKRSARRKAEQFEMECPA